MQTLIKWPGGKSGEFDYIKDLIPPFDRYIEPFFGGGAVFFQLKPHKAIINDICSELMDLYRFIKGEYNKEEFRKELYEYVINWEKVSKYVDLFEDQFVVLYNHHKRDKINEEQLEINVEDYIKNSEDKFNGLFHKNFCLDGQNLLKEIKSNIVSKICRTKQIEKTRGQLLNGDLQKNIETAFRSGFYMHFRDVMNFNGNKYKISRAKQVANYYFIREFCYGSMFRFNARGFFNIPYGGIAYNSKDFRAKIDYLFSEDVENLFKNTTIKNQDFEQIFHSFRFERNDFIFLDPPYDTDFSGYEKGEFNKIDQERLARCLYKIQANFILIIKNTPFIYGLYNTHAGIKIDRFEKTYLYNVKGRNNRDAEHLIIYNF